MYEQSLVKLNKALDLKPGHLPTIKNKLKLLSKMNMKEEYLNFLEKIIPFHPKETDLYYKKAQVLSELGMNYQSLNTYKTILMIDPEFPFVLGNVVNDKLKNCSWDGLERDLDDLKNKINEEKEIADPLLISTLFDSTELLNKATKIWNKQYDVNDSQFKPLSFEKNSKINIGYFSADFRDHPIGHLIAEMLENHDKSKYEIYGFYLGNKHKENDRFYLRIKKTFTKFYDVSNLSDKFTFCKLSCDCVFIYSRL